MLCDILVSKCVMSSPGDRPSSLATDVQEFFEATHNLWCTDRLLQMRPIPTKQIRAQVPTQVPSIGGLSVIVETKIAETFSDEKNVIGMLLWNLEQFLDPANPSERDLIKFIADILTRVC